MLYNLYVWISVRQFDSNKLKLNLDIFFNLS